MKNAAFILLLCFLSLNFFGENNSKSRWKPINPSFDLIVDSLEKGFIFDDSNLHRDKQISRLYRISKDNPKKKVFQWRAHFWDARLQLKKNNADSTARLIEKAFKLVDSVKYTYDYIRLLHLRSVIHKDSPHMMYNNLKRVSDYYKEEKDKFMLAHVSIDIGNILNRLNDHAKALEYFLRAGTLYKQLNNSVYRAKNQLNVSNVLYLMNDKKQADDILKCLLEDPVCKKDTSFYINTLLSLTEHGLSKNKMYLFEAYELSLVFANKGLLIRTETLMGNYYQYISRPDSALYYYRKAERRVNSRLTDLLVPVLKRMSECFFALHISDSAYLYLRKYEHLNDSVDQVNSLAEIRRIESRASIEKYELELRQRKIRDNFHLVITLLICSFVVCVACLVCYIFWKKHREAQIKRKLKSLENKELSIRLEHEALQNSYFKIELELKERELASRSLQAIEKNQVLEALLEQIEKERESEHIEKNAAIKIIRNIKNHLGNGDEWDFFRMQFEKVHPDFFTELKKLCPSMTEGELRICSYIRIGMENKHIAQMLSLQHDSVKKTRYRIRKKLEIEQDDSLEDFLRNV